MIDDLSKTLKNVLDDNAFLPQFPELIGAEIRFDRPDSNFSAAADGTVNLFLYDIRENLELRDNTPTATRVGSHVMLRQPDRRIDCSYMVTAWIAQGNQVSDSDELSEQKLLGQALQLLGRFPKIPDPYLTGVLVGQHPALPLLVPKVDGMQGFADFWSTMGNPFRAAFTVTATISVPTFDPAQYPVVTSIAQDTIPETADPNVPLSSDTLVIVGGQVVFDEAGNEVALQNAQVELPDLALHTRTNGEGIFSFSQVPAGFQKFRAKAVGFELLETEISIPTSNMKFNLQPIP